MRRAFRLGLWLGVIAALSYMVIRLRRPGDDPLPAGPEWPPIRTSAPRPEPSAAPPAPTPAPSAPPASDRSRADSDAEAERWVDQVPPPEPDPPAPPAPRAAKKAARKSAKKKARATKQSAKRSASRRPARKARIPAGRVWVRPQGKVCPDSHPVKAKLSSRIFHVPGGLSYDRTTPDRCYDTADNASAGGFRQAKR